MGGEGGPLGEGAELGPDDFFDDHFGAGGGFKAAVGAGDEAVGVAEGVGDAFEAVGDDFGVFDIVGSGVYDAGNEEAVTEEGGVGEETVFVGVAGVGHGEHDRPSLHLGYVGPDVFEGYVTIVGAFIVAPADVEAHLITRDAL